MSKRQKITKTLPDVTTAVPHKTPMHVTVFEFDCGHISIVLMSEKGFFALPKCPTCKEGQPDRIVVLTAMACYDRKIDGPDFLNSVKEVLSPQQRNIRAVYECGCVANGELHDGDVFDDAPDLCPIHNAPLFVVSEMPEGTKKKGKQ